MRRWRARLAEIKLTRRLSWSDVEDSADWDLCSFGEQVVLGRVTHADQKKFIDLGIDFAWNILMAKILFWRRSIYIDRAMMVHSRIEMEAVMIDTSRRNVWKSPLHVNPRT